MVRANETPSEWANPGADLFLDIGGAPGLRAGVEEGLREAIRSGRLPRGARLPATRVLARDLGVSRGTVLAAYSQLATEGWIRGARGSATTVVLAADAGAPSAPAEPPVAAPRFDLRPGRPDPSSFPRAEWLRALRRALAAAPHDTLGYGSPQGDPALRAELAVYLRRARGLRVEPRNLVVTSGFTQGLSLVAHALVEAGVRRIAMEEPSMAHHRRIVRAAGLAIDLVGVDAEGARIDDIPAGAGAVVLTPNRQHPLGVTLSAARRARLLEWAHATAALVLEDDYDGEFRYDGHPLGALQSLEPRAVIYAGTVSKTLSPGVRLGWLAVPDALLEGVARVKELSDWHNSVLEQLAFAELLRSGAYDRHVRKMRLRYRRRRDVLLAALADAAPELPVVGAAAGLNVLLRLPDIATETDALAALAAREVSVQGLAGGDYYESEPPAGLIIGYAAAQEHAYPGAVAALSSCLKSQRLLY